MVPAAHRLPAVAHADALAMPQLFISHSSQDRAVAQRVADWLKSVGFEGLFLDVDPEAGIPEIGRA